MTFHNAPIIQQQKSVVEDRNTNNAFQHKRKQTIHKNTFTHRHHTNAITHAKHTNTHKR